MLDADLIFRLHKRKKIDGSRTRCLAENQMRTLRYRSALRPVLAFSRSENLTEELGQKSIYKNSLLQVAAASLPKFPRIAGKHAKHKYRLLKRRDLLAEKSEFVQLIQVILRQ